MRHNSTQPMRDEYEAKADCGGHMEPSEDSYMISRRNARKCDTNGHVQNPLCGQNMNSVK